MSLKDILLVLTVVLIWGLNFPISKYGLNHIPPLFFTALRFTVSFLVLLPFHPIPKGSMKDIFHLSLIFGLGHFGLLFYGLSLDIEASTASLLMQSGPVLAAVLGAVLLKEDFYSIQWLGLCTAFVGTAMIIGLPQQAPGALATLIVLVSAFLWAVSTMMMKKLKAVTPLQLMCWMSAFVTPMFIIITICVEGIEIPQAPPLAYTAVLFPSLCSTVLAYGIWNALLQRVPISQLSPFGLLVPFFGVIGGIVLMGDTLEFWEAIGGIVLLIGVSATSFAPAFIRRSKLRLAQSA